RMCTGAFGPMSRKATVVPVSCTTVAGISLAAMRQKRQVSLTRCIVVERSRRGRHGPREHGPGGGQYLGTVVAEQAVVAALDRLGHQDRRVVRGHHRQYPL